MVRRGKTVGKSWNFKWGKGCEIQTKHHLLPALKTRPHTRCTCFRFDQLVPNLSNNLLKSDPFSDAPSRLKSFLAQKVRPTRVRQEQRGEWTLWTWLPGLPSIRHIEHYTMHTMHGSAPPCYSIVNQGAASVQLGSVTRLCVIGSR